MIAIRRSTILADARARHSALSRMPHLRDVVLRADDPRIERVLSVVRVGASSPGVEASLADAKTVEDVDAVYRDYLGRGDVPSYVKTDDWVGRQITGGGHTLDVLVLSDYGSIVGPDGVAFRIGKSSQGLAQEYADAFHAILPSEKLLTDLENSADVKIGFIPVQKGGGADDSVEAVVTANDKAIAALDKVGATENDGLLKIGYRKAFVTRPNLDGGHIAIHGGRWSAAGGLVQPTSGHAHTEPNAGNSWSYSDYSHGLVLVSRKAKLDGVDVDLRTDVFGSDDPAIYGLVNGEGVKFDPVFPNAGASSIASFAVGSMSGSDESGGGGGAGGVDTTVSPTSGTSGGATGPSEGAPTAGIAGGAGGGGVVEKFKSLSTPSKVGVIALVLLVGGGVAWAVI